MYGYLIRRCRCRYRRQFVVVVLDPPYQHLIRRTHQQQETPMAGVYSRLSA